jgi:hypothetical protein
MPEQFPSGTGLDALLPITIPELSDPANIQQAFKNFYYGELDASSGTTTGTDLYNEPISVGGYLKKLFVDKANYTDKLSVFASTTSSELRDVISDETGSGALVFATSPTLVTPTLGVALATSINGTTIPTSKTLVTTDPDTVTNTMLAGSIANSKLVNSSVTIGSSSVSLGGTVTTISGLTSVTSTSFVGALTGNASTATAIAGSQTANYIYAGPSSGPSASATFRALVAADIPSLDAAKITSGTLDSARIPTLNQNTTGNAATATSVAGGSAGQVLYQSATGTTSFVDSTGAVPGYVLKYNGSSAPSWANPATLAAVDVAIRADNITGGNSTTLLGSIPYQSDTNTTTLLSPNTTTTKKFLRQTGSGTNGAAPAWDTLVNGDIPSALTGKTYNALSLTAATSGFTIAGGTTSRTLTVSGDATISGGSHSGTNTGDQTISLSGDASGSGTGTISVTLANSGVTTGTYKSVTVDAKGRVTGGTNPTTLSEYGITDAASSTHVHGNILNAGTLTTSVTATSPVKVLITNSSNNIGLLTTTNAGSTTFLRGDGTWGTPTGTYTLPAATTSTLGGVIVDNSSIQVSSGTISVKTNGITNGMLAGSIENAKLANSSVTIGSSSVSLGGTALTTIAGLSSVTSTAFVGALTGNASSATKAVAYSAASSTYPSTPANRIFVGSVAPDSGSVQIGDIWMW